MKTITRCEWVTDDPIYIKYHDEEWGVPVHDDRVHFEFLTLESAQAGLSWLTILKRREGYRHAFAGFDPFKVSRFNQTDIARLENDAGIIRNKLKIRAAIKNASIFLDIQTEWGSFDKYIWSFTDGEVLKNHPTTINQVPVTSELSDKVSADLKKRGMSFVGSTIMYAHLQAIGIINDHIVSCFRYNTKSG